MERPLPQPALVTKLRHLTDQTVINIADICLGVYMIFLNFAFLFVSFITAL